MWRASQSGTSTLYATDCGSQSFVVLAVGQTGVKSWNFKNAEASTLASEREAISGIEIFPAFWAIQNPRGLCDCSVVLLLFARWPIVSSQVDAYSMGRVKAQQWFCAADFPNVVNVACGTTAWNAAEMPVLRESPTICTMGILIAKMRWNQFSGNISSGTARRRHVNLTRQEHPEDGLEAFTNP